MNISSSNESKIDSTDESNNFDSNSSDCNIRPKFVFPPAPRLCKSLNNTSCSVSCQSDSSMSDGKIVKSKRRSRKRNPKALPPIGVFWDIENCQVPKNKSASSIVQKMREIFFDGYREAEFLVVCDVKKENAQIIQDLHDAQINLIHVASTCKNAADEKLRQSLRRFAETHPAPSAVVLLSGDINFAADLSDLRYRKKIHVILVHNSNVADALILCANESYAFSSITENLPVLKRKTCVQYEVVISNLPVDYDRGRLKCRLEYLSNNCGGRVVSVDRKRGTAVLRFASVDFASRAQRRLKGEDVFGCKIKVSNPTSSRESPSRNYSGRKPKGSDVHQVQTFAVPTQVYPVPDAGMSYSDNTSTTRDSYWKTYHDQEVQTKSLMMSQQDDRCSFQSTIPSLMNISHEQMWTSNLNSSGDRSSHNESKAGACGGGGFLPNRIGLHSSNDNGEESKIWSTFNNSSVHDQNTAPIELVISSLDSTIDVKDLRKILTNLLREYVMEVPGNRMPLFKLIELLENRFHTNVSVSEVNKLKDVCKITDEVGARIITLRPDIQSSPPASFNRTSTLYCSVHCPNGLQNRGWGEPETVELPNVRIKLKNFTAKLNNLLLTHMGTLPLLSFPVCYELEYGEPLPVDDCGVPLEHLVTCVDNVVLKLGGPNRNIKYIKQAIDLKVSDSEKEEAALKSVSPSVVSNIQLLCRELVDLLKTTDRCQLLLTRFIPAYHHHFGRQCRVADYGYTKLVDLFESQVISNVVQILGDGTRRTITLTHSAQIRRFTSDLIRMLKTRVAKQLSTAEFFSCYERTLARPFNPSEYGLCNLEDLLDEVPENNVVITRSDDCILIAIPKREQTAEEIMRTKQFAEDVINLLRHSPQCSMLFNKFVPAYHHHFGHQCKVSDYGFTKLIELFEAIPDTVRIEELPDGERKVCLTLSKALKVLGNQIADIIKRSSLASLPLEVLPSAYLREYGCPLKPKAYECTDVKELVSKLNEFIQVAYTAAGPLLVLVEPESKDLVAMRVWAILLKPPHQMSLSDFFNRYALIFHRNIATSKLEQLNDVVTILSGDEYYISLTPLYVLAAQLYHVVYQAGGEVLYSKLETMYRRYYGKDVCCTDFNEKSMEELVSCFKFALVIKGIRKRTYVLLNQKLAEFGIPLTSHDDQNSLCYRMEDSSVHWPPPPAHDLVPNKTGRGITPPKPDTPPEPGVAPWSDWNTPTKFICDVNLSIPMPAMQTPKLMSTLEVLMSPTKNLLCAHSHSLVGSVLPVITSPHPAELPMPDKLLGKDDSVDSGVNNNSNVTSENEMDTSSEQTGKI